MEYALVNNKKAKPTPKTNGICPMCGAPTISKCGNRKIWHWAHVSQKHCDPWWENETEWHRNWKAEFPEEYREIVHFDDNGEKHQADIKTSTGIILEFQNSPITEEELESRENFYQNMIWVVNGLNFIRNFHVLGPLPDPKSDFASDLVFMPIKHNNILNSHAQNKDFWGWFWKISENPNHNRGDASLVRAHPVSSIENEIVENYKGHHYYDWIKPRTIWHEAKCPVYIDLGKDILWRLEYHNYNLKCVRAVSKRKFIHDASIEDKVHKIASRFYPITKATFS